MLMKLFALGLAGAVGSLDRYGLSGWVQRTVGGVYPLGTAVVNIIGCLLFGLIWSFLERTSLLNAEIRSVLFVGFFGAFTTFSTMIFECHQMISDAQWLSAAGIILLQNGVGLFYMLAGVRLGRLI